MATAASLDRDTKDLSCNTCNHESKTITLIQISSERYDCTMDLAVLFDRSMTVEEFIITVLKEYPHDWGDFRLLDGLQKHPFVRDDSMVRDYKKGCIESMFPDELLKRKVVWAKATGGETCVDYNLLLDRYERITY